MRYLISDLAQHERPREKIVSQGAYALTDSELLAVIWGTGSAKESIIELTERVTRSYGKINISTRLSVKKVAATYDLTILKAAQLLAIFELGRRFFSKSNTEKYLHSPEEVVSLCEHMKNLEREELQGIFCDNKLRLLSQEILSIGSANMNLITPKDVFFNAIEVRAQRIFLVHNHPSGDPSPSPQDIEFTKNISLVGNLLGIEVIDHIIIGRKQFNSLKSMSII